MHEQRINSKYPIVLGIKYILNNNSGQRQQEVNLSIPFLIY